MPDRSSSSVRIFYPRFTREELILALRRGLVALREKLPLKRAVLFGSWAQGKQTVASDVDLLVVYADPSREDAFALVKRTLNIRGLEPHVYSEAEYEGLKGTLERMAAGGVPLELE